MQIEGLTAVVTGGGSGLGEATARAFVSRGARVAILDLPTSNGAAIAGELGKDAIFAETDVTSEAAIETALDRALASFGAIHVNVNCAGIVIAARTLARDGVPHELHMVWAYPHGFPLFPVRPEALAFLETHLAPRGEAAPPDVEEPERASPEG